MTLLDVATATYALHAKLPDNSDVIVPHSGLAWEELTGEVATRITATLPDLTTEDGVDLAQSITLGTPLTVLAAMADDDLAEVARGFVEEVQPNDGTGGTFQVIAYDPLRALLTDKEDYFYPADQTPGDRIRDLAGRHNIPLGTLDDSLETVTLPGKPVHGETLADVLLAWIQHAHEKGTPRLVARSTQGRLEVVRPGTNDTVYWFRQNESALRMPERLSTVDLVTRVVVLGQSANDAASPVVATLEGHSEYGTRTDMIHLASSQTPDQIELAARLILEEKGRPRHDRSWESPDAPKVRKWDRHRFSGGTLDGYYLIESVTHDEPSGTIRMSLGNVEVKPIDAVFAMQDPKPSGPLFVYQGQDQITDAERYALAVQCGGWSPADAITAVAISIAEDRNGDPRAESKPNTNGSTDLGLWQINSSHWAAFGGKAALMDPCNNAKAAYSLWKGRGGNFKDWSTFNDGSYLGFMDRATTAAATANAQGTQPPSGVTAQQTTQGGGTVDAAKLNQVLQPWMGTRYLWGGMEKNGVDCSGLVVQVYRQLGVPMGRETTTTMWAKFQPITEPQVGDLVFFNNTCTDCGGNPTHVGIYTGNGQMTSAIGSSGVSVQNLSTAYWQQHLAGYRRVKA